MKQDIIDLKGAVVDSVELDESVWGIEPHISVMHQALVMQLANARQGTHNTKNRAEVRGGGRKPWRQKGTGRARQGSIRSPQWAGGGVVFGPKSRDYTQRMPKRMRRLAVRSALSAKLRDERVTVVDGLLSIEPRTKAMKDVLAAMPESRSFLLVIGDRSDDVSRSANNLENVKTLNAAYLNVRDLLKYDRIIFDRASLDVVDGILALPADKREPGTFKAARMAAQAEGVAENG